MKKPANHGVNYSQSEQNNAENNRLNRLLKVYYPFIGLKLVEIREKRLSRENQARQAQLIREINHFESKLG